MDGIGPIDPDLEANTLDRYQTGASADPRIVHVNVPDRCPQGRLRGSVPGFLFCLAMRIRVSSACSTGGLAGLIAESSGTRMYDQRGIV
jgi:hypothetical protein